MKHAIIIAFALVSFASKANELPHGWFITTADQYIKEDISWRKGVLPNKVVADFNGDKISDTAWVLTDKEKTKLALFVSLSSINKKHIFLKLDENVIKNHIYVGISNLNSGKYKTACGKGYWECDNNEKPFIIIKNTGINYFVFESANSIYVCEEKEFKRIWLSD